MSNDEKMPQDRQQITAAILAEYSNSDNEVERIKKQLDEANKKRSDVVKKLYDTLGKCKGPFSYKGKYLGRIVIRGNTYFFRSGKDEVIDVK